MLPLNRYIVNMSTRSTFLYSIILVISCEVTISWALSISTNQTVSVGDTVTIVCTTKLLEPVHWKHRRVGETKIDYVYRDEIFDDTYRTEGRFRLEKRDGESYALMISNVKKSDAGNYMCIEDNGAGANETSEIVIVESKPICHSNDGVLEVVGENSCGMAPGFLLFKCSLGYFGNVAPTLEWRARDNGDVIGTGSYITKANVVTSSLTVSTLSSFAADTSKLSCRVKMPQPHALMCKPEAISILYAVNSTELIRIEKTAAEIFNCSANVSDSLSCSYKWVDFKGRDIIYGKSIDLQDPVLAKSNGIYYQCLADCELLNKQCTVKGMLLKLEQGDMTWYLVKVCVGGLIAFLIIMGISIGCRYAKKYFMQRAIERDRRNHQEMEALNPNYQPYAINQLEENGAGNPMNGYQPQIAPNQAAIEDSREVCLPDNSNLIGIDWLENKIYALSFNLKCVFVFSDVAPYQEFKDERISLKSTDQVDDIASCRTCRALFVSDYTEKKLVYKIEILNKDVRMWPMGGKPSKLSTTASGHLLVIVRGLDKAFLEIYNSTDMSKLKTVDFPRDIGRPIKAIENSGGLFVVLYRSQHGEDVIAEIMLGGDSSSVVRYLNLSSQRADKSRQLSHLVVGRDDTMYIADDGNMKLLRVDNLFHSCTVFRQFQVGGMPYRLCYARESGKLIAGQWSPGLFQIFGNA